MLKSILLAILMSGLSSGSVSPEPVQPEPVRIVFHGMTLSGNSIEFAQSDVGTFRCEMKAGAEIIFGSGEDIDMTITATNITLTKNPNAEVVIHCSGDCVVKDSEHLLRSNLLQIHLADKPAFQLTGHCRVEYGEGENRTVLTGDTITCQSGVFNVMGPASLQRGTNK